ncbi:MAG TPA: GEVED domain-containing protein, partial [Phycisphaerales bacterium]|nr:GEVED domain-containing protein [Phycisphaerales bacterium]
MGLLSKTRTWAAALATAAAMCCGTSALAQGPVVSPNDLCAGAVTLSVNTPATGRSTEALGFYDGPAAPCQPTSNFRGVWFKFSPSATGRYQINASGSRFDSVVTVYSAVDCTGNDDALFVVTPGGCADDQGGAAPGPATTGGSTLATRLSNLLLTTGTTYYIRLSGFSASGMYQVGVYDYSCIGACCSTAGICSLTMPESCATGSGAYFFGSGSTCTVNPCVGACCDNTSGACTITLPTTAACATASNTWQGYGSVCTAGSCVQGACCTSGAVCTLTTFAQCTSTSSWQSGVTCGTANAACYPLGACCLTTSPFTCTLLSSGAACASGSFAGFGTTCPSGNICATGVCCSSSFGCTVTVASACTGSSKWLPGFTSCTTNPCSSACCTSAGVCTITTGAACPTGTSKYGTGSTCSPNPCVVGACCSTAGVCTLTIDLLCESSSSYVTSAIGPALYFIAGGTCTPNPCTGACCDNSTLACSIQVVGTAGCVNQGLFSTCACAPCASLGQCCSTTASCTVTTASGCVSPSTWTAGTTCATLCPGAGQCCTSSLTCTVTLSTACTASTSQWTAGTSCSVPCVNNGNCCNATTFACTLTVANNCLSPNTFTVGGSCSPNLCSGACCTGTTCSIVGSMTDCQNAGGTWQGAGTNCGGTYAAPIQGTTAMEDISATGTAITVTGTLDQGYMPNVPIGFTFGYFNQPYTTLAIGTNGILALASGATPTNDTGTIPSATSPNGVIATFWADQNASSANQIRYQTLGTAPNRRFITQWTAVPFFSGGGALTYQVILYESPVGAISMRYGTMNLGTNSGTRTVGVENATGLIGTSVASTVVTPGNVSLLWIASDNSCNPPASGACCTGSSCSSATAGACLTSGGSYQGDGVSCSPNPCITGACCTTALTCSNAIQSVCLSGSGNIYGGDNTTCGTYTCPTDGACCADDGTCALTAPAACASPSIFLGLSSTCSSCVTSTIACCNDTTAACIFALATTCPSGSHSTGPGSVCTPNTCSATAYCSDTATSTSFEKISNVTIESLNYTDTVTTAGYIDLTAQTPPTLLVGVGSPITVTIRNCYSSDQCTVYIDWNHNLGLLDMDETFSLTHNGCTASNFTGTITPPAGALTGTTRMRVVMGDGTSPACGSYTFGQVWDFTVNVAVPAVGACCGTDGSCSVQLPTNCASPSLYLGASTSCSGANCPSGAATACCDTTTAACTFILSTASCPSGTVASGSLCSPNSCPTAGACCANDGTCSQTDAASCTAPSLFQGLGTTCNPGCPVAVTACCNAVSGACSFVNGATCPFGTATGSTCSPNPCVGLPGITHNFDASGSLPACFQTSSTGLGAIWAVDTAVSNSPLNSVATNDVGSVSSQFLTLPTYTALGTVTLDYWFRFNTEAGFDGWVVEASINGGAFTNIGAAAFAFNGYNDTISTGFSSPIGGQDAYSGETIDFALGTQWFEAQADIPGVNAGDTVTIRFQMASDSSVGVTGGGVWLDDITVANVAANGSCCDIAGACTYTTQAACTGPSTWSAACTCSPNPCPQPPSGVCCRGATCSTAYTSAAACAAAYTTTTSAVTSFVSNATACNASGVTTTPCCYANYNHNATLEVGDIFDFLNDWFAGNKAALVGGDGDTGALQVQNIFDFLNAWFAGG